MKHGKKLSRKMKELLTSKNLNPVNWLVVKDTSTEYVFVHRQSNRIRTIVKG